MDNLEKHTVSLISREDMVKE
eukprot:COSAG05_NODE_18733_length_304_cov_0.263415_2_plen_20_part_01